MFIRSLLGIPNGLRSLTPASSLSHGSVPAQPQSWWEWCHRQVDPFSLRFRLTAGITLATIVGFSGVTLWTNWKMQQVLVASYKQNITSVAQRFTEDVQLYSEMLPVEVSIRKAINNREAQNLILWVAQPDGTILPPLPDSMAAYRPNQQLVSTILTDAPEWFQPQVYRVGDSHFVVCKELLIVGGNPIGTAYVAQNITTDQNMLMIVTGTLSIASLLTVLVMTLAIALYIQRSLQPLCQISSMTRAISADDLEAANLKIEGAPSEVSELAETFNMMLTRLSDAWAQQRFSWEQQRQFVSNVSHELRTPLTIVHGYLQSILRRGENLTDAQREALQIAATEAEQTTRLLQDLLDLARADSGYIPFQFEPVLLNELVAEVAAMAEKCSQRQIVIKAKAPHLVAIADRNRLRQVLLNLIDNAVKYSEAVVTIQLERIEDRIQIQVCDRGRGIPLQHQSRIFERFYRVDEARTRSTGGYGLGLSIVKTLTEGMHGQVSVRSELGEGSIFTVTLPVYSAKL